MSIVKKVARPYRSVSRQSVDASLQQVARAHAENLRVAAQQYNAAYARLQSLGVARGLSPVVVPKGRAPKVPRRVIDKHHSKLQTVLPNAMRISPHPKTRIASTAYKKSRMRPSVGVLSSRRYHYPWWHWVIRGAEIGFKAMAHAVV